MKFIFLIILLFSLSCTHNLPDIQTSLLKIRISKSEQPFLGDVTFILNIKNTSGKNLYRNFLRPSLEIKSETNEWVSEPSGLMLQPASQGFRMVHFKPGETHVFKVKLSCENENKYYYKGNHYNLTKNKNYKVFITLPIYDKKNEEFLEIDIPPYNYRHN